MSVLYIQIRRNQITVRDLESKREVSGDAAFSNQRLLIANFFVAEKVLQDLVLQLHPRSTWHSFLPAKRMDIVVSALEMNEGGLSQVEAMPNSEVKRRSADGSVGSPHARVGNCQTSNQAKGHPKGWPFCFSN